MPSKSVVVGSAVGLHARPAAIIAEKAGELGSDVTINGESVGEMGIEACYAAHWDVPCIMAQCDEHGSAEAEARFPGIVTATVKSALSYDLAVSAWLNKLLIGIFKQSAYVKDAKRNLWEQYAGQA